MPLYRDYQDIESTRGEVGSVSIFQDRRLAEIDRRFGKSIDVEIVKTDTELGIVFGFAIVSKINGEPYYDTQGDFIPEASMLKATASFMASERIAKDMHQGGPVGQVVFGFPLTTEIAKALDIKTEKTGFIVGMKPASDSLLSKYRNGEYTGFSIGGRRLIDTDI